MRNKIYYIIGFLIDKFYKHKSMTPEQLARFDEMQADICALTTQDKQSSGLIAWLQQYVDYVKYGTTPTLAHPPHKPVG